MMGNDRLSESELRHRSGLGRSGWIAIALAAAFLLVFAALAIEVSAGDTSSFDDSVLGLFRSATDPGHPIGPARFREMMRDITALGSYGVLGILVFSVLAYLLLLNRFRLAVLLTVAVAGGLILSNLFKMGFDRARPETIGAPQVFSASFPSGHAMLSAVIYLTLGAILSRAAEDRRIRAFFIVLAVFLTLVIGMSRIYLGVHFPTDVLAGWCLGAAWSLACLTAALWLQQRKRRP